MLNVKTTDLQGDYPNWIKNYREVSYPGWYVIATVDVDYIDSHITTGSDKGQRVDIYLHNDSSWVQGLGLGQFDLGNSGYVTKFDNTSQYISLGSTGSVQAYIDNVLGVRPDERGLAVYFKKGIELGWDEFKSKMIELKL